MRDKLKPEKQASNPEKPSPSWLIILLTVIFPPTGFYLAQKYHHEWVISHKAFSVTIAVYTVFIIFGVILDTRPHNHFSDSTAKIYIEHKTQEEAVDFETLTVMTGEPQDGKNGIKRVEYEIKYLDGKEIGRIIVKEEVIEQPQNEIIILENEND